MLVPYRAPYDWDAMQAFLASHIIRGVEAVQDGSYRRVVSQGWVELTFAPAEQGFRVARDPSLGTEVLAQVEHLLDLACDPVPIGVVLGPLAAAKPGLRVPGTFDGFEIATRAILGQQVSVAAACTLAGRLAAAFGTPVRTPFPELTTAFPSPDRIAREPLEALTKLGILPSRARTILALAAALTEGRISLQPGADAPRTIVQLQSIVGIGPWTAQYIAMRALAWRDAFLPTDLHVRRALGNQDLRRILEAAEAWRPWRAYAVMHLWNGGGNGGGNALR